MSWLLYLFFAAIVLAFVVLAVDLTRSSVVRAAVLRARVASYRPVSKSKLKGKRIEVKWYDEGPLTAEAQRRRGKQGKFFMGKVLSWDGKKKVYRVEYDDDLDGVYETNFIDKATASYIPSANWRVV